MSMAAVIGRGISLGISEGMSMCLEMLDTKRVSNSIVAAGTTVALAPASVWAQQPSDPYRCGYGPHMMDWGGPWYGMIFGPLFMILVLAVVISVAVLLVRWFGGPWHWAQPPHHVQPGRALDILKERYARGDIDKQEFDERRRVIGD